MKKILLALALIMQLSAVEHKLLVHGITDHKGGLPKWAKPLTGMDKLNDYDFGLGYEYTTYTKQSSYFYNVSASVLNDSTNHLQYSAIIGVNTALEVTDNIELRFGANIGVCHKYLILNATEEIKPMFIPALFPRVGLKVYNIELNVVVVPTVESIGIAGFIHYSLAIKF